MPGKGQKSITVGDETFNRLEAYAKKNDMSVAGVVAWAAESLDDLALTKAVKEQYRQADLVRAYFALDSFVSFYDALTTYEKGTLFKRKYLDLYQLVELFRELNNGGKSSLTLNYRQLKDLARRAKEESTILRQILNQVSRNWEGERSLTNRVRPIELTDKNSDKETEKVNTLVFIPLRAELAFVFGDSAEKLDEAVKSLERAEKEYPELDTPLSLIKEIYAVMSGLIAEADRQRTNLVYGS